MRIPDNKGVTLIEIVVALAIVGIVAAITVPNMVDWRRDRQLRGAANNLASNIQLARLSAVREAEFVTVRFDTNTNAYSVFVDPDQDGQLDAGERTLRDVTLPSGVTYTSVVLLPDNLSAGIAFFSISSKGLPTITGDSTVTLQYSAADTIVLELNRVGRVVIVTP